MLHAEEVSFNRDIRPILSDRCFFCHGPDPANREADLRLDTREGAADVLESGELLRRITSDESYERMPPEETNLSVSEAEIELLTKWIEAGAEYDTHWSFKPLPMSVSVPPVQVASWPKNPIDNFVLARLEAASIKPTHEASEERWFRRVTFALTGVPPTLNELAAFRDELAQSRQDAYERNVDRLLASPQYGEHMAVSWLDAVRYADSYGYQSDQLNTQWPYRNWVVRAFNENLPYDKFLTYQLAGDLLPDPTPDQRLATAFNRLHRLTNEGGAVPEEWRQENVADRVHTFGTAILGLTLECARCHDHKYDPITSRDYYSLSAFFNSIDENGLYDGTSKVPSPTMLLPNEEESKLLEDAASRLRKLQATFKAESDLAVSRWEAWVSSTQRTELKARAPVVALSFDENLAEVGSEGYFCSTDNRAETDSLSQIEVSDSPFPNLEHSSDTRRALQFDGERGVTIKQVPSIDRWTPFTLVLTLREPKRNALPSVLAQYNQGTDAGFNGWDLLIENGYVESRLYRVWPGNAIGVRTQDPISLEDWHQVSATYDGSSQAGGLKLYLDGKELATEVLRDRIVKSASLLKENAGGLVIGQRFRSRGFTGGQIDDVRFYEHELTPTELNHLATGDPLAPTCAFYREVVDPAYQKTLASLTEARKNLTTVEEFILEVPIMEELPEPIPAHVLARGQYDAPKSKETLVERTTFSQILGELPADVPRNRLGLAQWVTNPDHPLTSRVLVNAIWQRFFGVGLVRTPENFGLQGELPTHPELLDWLARDFVEHGWDLKRLCRQIALSATFRQNSATSQEQVTSDPENRLLARGPSFRLSAEQIRDLALTASGLINEKSGGPPVSPYQAGGDLWKESNAMSPSYRQSVGKSLYRRSLYSIWKRTAPLPNMMAFDATSREVCSVSRSRTNTPLQALVLLNDVQIIEASRQLALKALDAHADEEEQIRMAFLALTSTQPTEYESSVLKRLLHEELEYYRDQPEDALAIIEVGESAVDSSHPNDQLAAMTMTCLSIMNLDATVWSR